MKAVSHKFKDSGKRQSFGTGAVRDVQAHKGRFDLLPWIAIFLVSRIFEDGCIKYGDRNWERGIPIGRYLDSACRHIAKYSIGLRDEPHLSMACWNLLCALWTAARIHMGLLPAELFDLPSHVGGKLNPLSPYEIEALNTLLGTSDRVESRT